MPTTIYPNYFETTIAADWDAPASGTSQVKTIVTGSAVPVVASGEQVWAWVGNANVAASLEAVLITLHGSGSTSVTVTRGADGRTPVTHSEGDGFYGPAVLGDVFQEFINLTATDVVTDAMLAETNARTLKEAVRVATTAALTLASDFENGDTVDGVVLATGDRILIKNQASGGENGIYTVAASGAPTRASDANTAAEFPKSFHVAVQEGTTNGGTLWQHTTTAAITLGTTALTFVQVGGGGGPHEHTAADVGPLTDDEHAGYSEYARVAAPAAPSDGGRLFFDTADAQFKYIDDGGDTFRLGPHSLSSREHNLGFTAVTSTGALNPAHYLHRIDASSGSVTLSLPAANTLGQRHFLLQRTDNSGNTVTVDPDGAETINGAATLTIDDQYDALYIECDGTAWYAQRSLYAGGGGLADHDHSGTGAGGGPDLYVAGDLQADGPFYLANHEAPAQLTGNVNDWAPTAGKTVLRASSDASWNVTGLVAGLGTGERKLVINIGSNDIVFKHQDAASSAANRFSFGGAADITLAAGEILYLWYDSTDTRWRGGKVVTSAGGGGSVATDTIWDAAGDMVQGTGSNTAARTAIGTAGQLWRVNSGATAGEWASLETAKAWVNFNGTGTVAIRDSFNVTSVTDNGTGDYTVNLTTVMANANYAAVAMSNQGHTVVNAIAAGTIQILTFNLSNAATDASTVCVIAFGDQ